MAHIWVFGVDMAWSVSSHTPCVNFCSVRSQARSLMIFLLPVRAVAVACGRRRAPWLLHLNAARDDALVAHAGS
jgi:hypothetical protein